ncbi:MAG: hypothetical protein GY708_29985 [Actinomycetia bacterium]|nr:hypothetical protein [Actinomycetes bacterium]
MIEEAEIVAQLGAYGEALEELRTTRPEVRLPSRDVAGRPHGSGRVLVAAAAAVVAVAGLAWVAMRPSDDTVGTAPTDVASITTAMSSGDPIEVRDLAVPRLVPGDGGWALVDRSTPVRDDQDLHAGGGTWVWRVDDTLVVLVERVGLDGLGKLEDAEVDVGGGRVTMGWLEAGSPVGLQSYGVDAGWLTSVARTLQHDETGWTLPGGEVIVAEPRDQRPAGAYQFFTLGRSDPSNPAVISGTASEATPGDLYRTLFDASSLGPIVAVEVDGNPGFVMQPLDPDLYGVSAYGLFFADGWGFNVQVTSGEVDLAGVLVEAKVVGSDSEEPVITAASGTDLATPGTAAEVGVAEREVTSMGLLVAMVKELRRAKGDYTAACMSERGFPQLVEAELLRSNPGSLALRDDPLHIDPLDLGPHTEEQALQYGMTEATFESRASTPGKVISDDAAWDEVFEDCGAMFDATVAASSEQVSDVMSTFVDLFNEVGPEFSEATRAGVADLLEERFTCLRDGSYPQLDVDAAVGMGFEVGRAVGLAGVPYGETVEPDTSELDRSVEPGQVVVFRPVGNVVYTPSPAETEFALAWVQCGEQVDFVDRLEDLQEGPRTEILARHEVTIIGLLETIDQLEMP